MFVANLIEYHQEGFRPERDIIVALTTDEELVAIRRTTACAGCWSTNAALIDAEFAINEGGGGALRNGKPFRLGMQLAEKVYQTYVLEVSDPGGHSASPRRDNPIYRLAAALVKLSQFDFPAAAECRDARQFPAAGRDRSAADGRGDQGAAVRLNRCRRRSHRCRPIRTTMRRCAPPASPRCWRRARSRTRCRRRRAPR